MITGARTRSLLAGLALILATNAAALMGVAYNRSGKPESMLMLTQRELALPYSSEFGHENSGLALRLRWRVSGQVGDPPAWLDQAKLAALGFDVSKPVATPEGRRYYAKLLPRQVILVLELDGPAYQAALEHARQHLAQAEASLETNARDQEFKQRAQDAKAQFDQEEHQDSRLFVIDAGLDVAALRARYADRTRYALVRGRIQPWVIQKEGRAELSGYVDGLSVSEVNVPLTYRPIFEPSRRESAPRTLQALLGKAQDNRYTRSPRYEVSVAFGKRLEPWMTGASALRNP